MKCNQCGAPNPPYTVRCHACERLMQLERSSPSGATVCSASSDHPETDHEWRRMEHCIPDARAKHMYHVSKKMEEDRNYARKSMTENPWCASCKESDCVVSGDGTCAMIRKYLSGGCEVLDVADVQQFLIDEHARMMWSLKDLPRGGTGSLTARHKVRGAIDFGVTLSNWISRKQIELSEQNRPPATCSKCGGDGYVVKIIRGPESQAGVAEDCECQSSQNMLLNDS